MKFQNALKLVLLFLVAVSIMPGCKKMRKGVVEVRGTFLKDAPEYAVYNVPDDYAPKAPSGTVYTTRKYSEMLGGYDEEQKQVYWEDRSAKGLGYSERSGDGLGLGSYVNKEGYRVPGKNGYWGNSGSGSTSTGSTSGACSGGYTGPSGDAQLDSYCQTAYAYRCLDGKPLSDPGVQYACQTYEQMKEPGVPECPYCK